MKLIGITGNIGAGKSFVSKLFNQKFNIPIFDTDKAAKEIMNIDEDVKLKLIDLLGPEIYYQGILNKELMAKRLFNDSNNTKLVQQIISPAVKKVALDWANIQISAYVLIESAIIFESNIGDWFNQIITVIAPLNVRWQRISERDPNRSNDEINRIINKQMSQEEKACRSNYVIVNNGQDLGRIIDSLDTVFDW